MGCVFRGWGVACLGRWEGDFGGGAGVNARFGGKGVLFGVVLN